VPPQSFDEYRLIRLLGRGSMGSVYLAHDDVLDRPVAVKFIGNVAPDAEDRDRFLVEARAVARIQHPNVMVIYRVGELEGHPFLITEYIRGKSLSELTVPLPWRKVLEMGIGLARGLATAHRMGVLHRDIKLANAVLADDGEIKLLDFSLAKLLDEGAPEMGPRATSPTSAPRRGPRSRRSSATSARVDRASIAWPRRCGCRRSSRRLQLRVGPAGWGQGSAVGAVAARPRPRARGRGCGARRR
jgi:serine/threonine protein kinase